MMLESTTLKKSIAYSDKFILPSYIERSFSDSKSIEELREARMIESGKELLRKLLETHSKPQTQSILIENEEEEFIKLTYQILELPIRYKNEIIHRLRTLFKDSKYEDPLGSGITAGSLRSFISFLELHPNIKQPTISLTPEHNIYVSWKYKDKVFSAHFLPDKNVRFVVFIPNFRYPERKIRVSGIATVDVLIKIVEPFGVTEWIFDERR